QVIHFAKALVAADGRGAGWVTDADTAQGLPRFHPCSPDGAAWVVLGLLLADVVRGDAQALPLTRDILRRHAGLAPDGVAPQRSADGIYRHWYNPTNGGPYPGWDTEFATLSTMKIVAAAVRARRHFRNDSVVRIAADTIANTIRNHAAYVREQPDGLYFKALPGGGPDVWSLSLPFHEGILFVEQAAAFADPVLPRYARWLDRARWPTAELVTGKPVTGNVPGWFQAAFVTLYPWLLQKDFRSSPAWQQQVKHLWYSHAAWNDANGPQWFAVFSAGTTPGGYNADSLSHHPHDIASFPALLAFCAAGDTAPAVSAYQAYRTGARQTFASGASLLYRRSNTDPAWLPNNAGLPDVVLGAAGLAELLQPGVVDRVWALDMDGDPFQITSVGEQLELTWPLLGWRVFESTNLVSWEEQWNLPNPWRFTPGSSQRFYRLRR
ncbi:MAG: hypothetical protein RMK20_08160, partial [Verrucomicrobiales bacterium]|nr:hypothetical protein [Verrucomicrobiales bacterium]